MWQFIGSSGTRFGLVQNSDIDERKDIIKSTRAAITYFIYLHDMFGSWELAIAAYNWGEGNINNALKNSSSTNFYDLDVRDITHQYVPKVIALANIIQNPSKFGIKLTNLKNQPYFAAINPAMPTTVNQFMTMANMSTLDNKKLNPQYNSLDYLVKQNQKLLLPVTSQSAYFASIGGAPTMAQNNSPAIQASAPIVSAVSNESPSVTTAQDNNNASAATAIVAAVAVPIINDGINQLAAGSNNADTPATTTTNPAVIISNQPNGNTSIALSKSAITDLLGGGSVIATGAVTKPVNKNSTSEINYTVTQGDTLYSIAKKFAVPIASIIQDNQILDNTVKLNQTLVIRNPNNS